VARTESAMIALGTQAPEFLLKDVTTGKPVSMKQLLREQGLLVMFICRHCPFVKHIEAELAKLGQNYRHRDVGIVAISSNDSEAYPDDAPASLKQQAHEAGFPFPYLFDENQDVARAYDATCTPDFFLFDGDLKLVYRGQFDDSRPENGVPVTGRDLRAALDALLQGKPVSQQQRPSLGCNIKWKTIPCETS
jgi:peroxiredoxin